ncbi:MAG: signal peptidase I [Bacilli bacterium]|jgi:signal peptidase I|nr:signal peptidase I [Bacilli bacterium]
MDWLSIKEFLLDMAKYFLIICAILFTITYIFSITQVVGDSMNPGLQDGEVLILNKFKYRFSKVKRGDIISLKYADGKYLIKRVIGLPGDKVEIINSKLYINDKIYEENYLKENMSYPDFRLSDLNYQKIPEDNYLVLGDNRENSVDSREIGLIKKSDINGKISFRFWPLTKIKFL